MASPLKYNTRALCGTFTRYDAGCRCDACKDAKNKHVADWGKANPELLSAQYKRHYAKKKAKPIDVRREQWLQWRYGCSTEQRNQMLQTQNNCCAICKRKFNENVHALRPHMDHNHLTKKIRAMLCTNCNTTVGLCDERRDILEQTIRYIETDGSARPTDDFVPRETRAEISSDEEIQICQERKGSTIDKLSEKWKVGRATIERILRKHGISKAQLTATDASHIRELSQTKSQAELALQFNVSLQSIRRVLQRETFGRIL